MNNINPCPAELIVNGHAVTCSFSDRHWGAHFATALNGDTITWNYVNT